MCIRKYMLIEWQISADAQQDAGQTIRRVERVLWMNLLADQIIVIDSLNPRAFPVLRKATEIIVALKGKSAYVLEKDPFSKMLIPEGEIDEKHKRYRDE